jgi:DNA-binding transcriptional ArsR family regulator
MGPANLTPDTARQVAQMMQGLAAPSRVMILGRLWQGPSTVSDLAEAVGMEQSAVSHQLRLLRHLELVVVERRGRHSVYQLHDDHVAELLAEAVYHVEHVQLGHPSVPREPAVAAGDRLLPGRRIAN